MLGMSQDWKGQRGITDTAASFGFTFGESHIQKTWSDFQRITWPALVEKLTSHIPGIKEGACIVPAKFRGTSRQKESAEQIDVAFLDSDGGMPLAEIEKALKRQGWEAVISSTHSHMATVTRVARSNWDRYLKEHPHGDAEAFLLEEKEYRTEVASGAYITDTTEKFVYFEHRPCPKFRVVVPLERPWIASSYPSQEVANDAWAKRIEALAHALGLPHDQSCTDTSRLFYLPRRPENGAIPETSIIAGKHCDIFSLSAPAVETHGIAGGLFGEKPRNSVDDLEFTDPITGEIIDLLAWARTYGDKFLIAKALKTHGKGVFTGHSVDNKIHIDCPNIDEHTDPARDGATFVVNANRSKSKGFVIHCRHAHCTGRDRLFFLRKMLERGWLPPDSLTAPEFLIEPTEPEQPQPAPDPATGDGIPFPATPLRNLDLSTIPPRPWLYGRELLRGFVSVLGSPGGVGKTAYTHGIGVGVAANLSLLAHDKEKPSAFQAIHHQGAVWFYNLEDPSDELRRRMKALLIYHKVSFDQIADMVFVDSGRDRPLIITKRDERGNITAHPVKDDLVRELLRRDIVLLVVDPFVQSHTAEENRNEEMNAVMSLWSQVAHQANCAVWLIHHFRKGGQGGDSDSFRGAASIQGAARVMSTLSAMSPEEASKLGVEVEHRRQYVRLDNAKANMAPAADKAEWYRLVSVPIGNTQDSAYPEGDHVQTIEPWEPPSPWDGVTWSTIDRVLNRLQDGPSPDERYAAAKQSKDRWAGHVLVEVAGKTEGQAASIIKAWIESGVLEQGVYPSPGRKGALTACVSVNPQKAAEMKAQSPTGGLSDEG